MTFGNGTSQYSNATAANYSFFTTYLQRLAPVTNDGQFSFINSIGNDFGGVWHTGAEDHTIDEKGYMFLVNADLKPGQFFNRTIDNLCVGQQYEFSLYLANICKNKTVCLIDPNVRFEMRSTSPENKLLAQYTSGNVPINVTVMVWNKYGFSFVPPTSSVVLLMISAAKGGAGNDLALDDIALRICSRRNITGCPSS